MQSIQEKLKKCEKLQRFYMKEYKWRTGRDSNPR